MPNHVVNNVKVRGDKEVIAELFNFVMVEEAQYENNRGIGTIDFNKIVPETCGENEWYNWRIKNWGTKWNAYEQKKKEKEFNFWTAWSMPHEIYLALSLQYPNLTFEVTFADENIGYNCGKVVYQNGKPIAEFKIEEGTKFADNFANKLWNRFNKL